MSVQTNITAFDGAATPTSHLFTGAGTEVVNDAAGLKQYMAEWKEFISSLPDYALARITFRKRYLKKQETWRVSIAVDIPYMETATTAGVNGYTAVAKVAYVNSSQFVGYYHRRSSEAERRFGRQLLVNVAGGITTTVTPVQTGNAAELIDKNVTPT